MKHSTLLSTSKSTFSFNSVVSLRMFVLLSLGFATFQAIRSETKSSYKEYQVWRVLPSTKLQLDKLREIGEKMKLDFWREPTSSGVPVTFLVHPELRREVKANLNDIGIKSHQVDLKDVQTAIEQQKKPNKARMLRSTRHLTVTTFDYTRYHPPHEVYEWMGLVAQEFNKTATKRQYGISYEGRPLYALEFTRNTSETNRPKIFIDSLIHCREWITTASLLFIFKEMLTNRKYAHMMEDVDWYFVPMVNVDGYEETWNGDRLWRKTKSSGPSANCIGTDGNRNWDAFWSIDPCSNVYYGPTPASESEVRHLANYVLGLGERAVDAYLSTHSASQLILYPYIYKVGEISADDAILNETGKSMSEAVRKVHNKEYVYGRGSTTIYPASGTTTDWSYEKAKIVQSYTYELRDTGQYGHLLPPDQIIPNGEEYLEGIRALKDYVLAHYSI